MDLLCFFCLVFVILFAHLFICLMGKYDLLDLVLGV